MSQSPPLHDQIKSVGIDIGTTTTHLVISLITLAKTSKGNEVPKLELSNREIIYSSPIYRTPLDFEGKIDAKAVAQIIESEYERAKISPDQIETGAVIITGETARKRNAAELAQALSATAGQFVIAAAGPNYEGLVSGKGSGAAEYSLKHNKTVCNIDIGGGTTNFAVFSNGECIDITCLGLGARFIQFDDALKVSALTDSAEDFLDGVAKLNLITMGKELPFDTAQLLASLLSEVIMHTCTRKKAPQIVQRLLLTDAMKNDHCIDEFWFSGGVAECMNMPNEPPFKFNDMGILLARALLLAAQERNLSYKVAERGIRSTVIGAGSHSLQVSGFTVMVEGTEILPLKNIPILRPFDRLQESSSETEIQIALSQALNKANLAPDKSTVAIMLPDVPLKDYPSLQKWASAFADVYSSKLSDPLIILCKQDLGLALGQAIKRRCKNLALLILDHVDCLAGDYVDIGKPIKGYHSVPLTVKTLIYNP